MKRFLLLLMVISHFTFSNSCTKAETEEKLAPEFRSSIPANNETDVDMSSNIELTFNEVVYLTENHGITVNDVPATVEALYTKLNLSINMTPGTQYKILIPKGALVNMDGIKLDEEIELMFTTKEETVRHKDPNFHIYLCFGQSNMEGQGVIESQDKTVNERFQVLQALDCSDLGSKGKWRDAVPPLCQCASGLTPADYFGRTLIENLPDSIKVGVINMAIGGCDIRLFDKDIYQDYTATYNESWFTDKVAAYDGNPYQYLIDLAKVAQQDGVIKGILLHQGETNTGDAEWPNYVRKIYEDMMWDLTLCPDETPLLAGEVFSGESNCCSSMNPIINTLPSHIANAHVISSDGCTGQDEAHFDSAGYRELGKRYAVKMLSLLGYEDIVTE
nr:sialate O-acetylesterase [uncultured Carboxylicivirga sp.]